LSPLVRGQTRARTVSPLPPIFRLNFAIFPRRIRVLGTGDPRRFHPKGVDFLSPTRRSAFRFGREGPPPRRGPPFPREKTHTFNTLGRPKGNQGGGGGNRNRAGHWDSKFPRPGGGAGPKIFQKKKTKKGGPGPPRAKGWGGGGGGGGRTGACFFPGDPKGLTLFSRPRVFQPFPGGQQTGENRISRLFPPGKSGFRAKKRASPPFFFRGGGGGIPHFFGCPSAPEKGFYSFLPQFQGGRFS